jgi:hypothetical protein
VAGVTPVLAAKDKNLFTGKVISIDGRPVAFASISLKDQPDATMTDSNGSFSLRVSRPDTLLHITVRSAGYLAASTVLRNNVNVASDPIYRHFQNKDNKNYDNLDQPTIYGNQIRLRPENSMALKEISIAAKSRSKRKEAVVPMTDAEAQEKLNGGRQTPGSQKTEPFGGWAAYNNYLENNKKISTADSIFTGNEIVSFVVGRNGKLTSFRIGQSISTTHDAEVIRLVRQGPAWKLLKGRKERMTLIVTF